MVSLAIFMVTTDIGLLSIALPVIITELRADAALTGWIALIYALVTASLYLPCGRLSDLVGRARVFRIGFLLYAVSSLSAALAQSGGQLIFFRGCQAIGSALIMTNSFALVTTLFPPQERGRAMGISGGTVSALGYTLGPVIGGLLTYSLGWRANFSVTAFLAFVGFVAAFVLLRDDSHAAARTAQKESFDFVGALTFALGISALLLALTGGQGRWHSTVIWTQCLTGLLALVFFVWWEKRTQSPLLDLQLFRIPTFAFGNVARLITFITISLNSLLMPLFLQLALKLDPLHSGLLIAPTALALALLGIGDHGTELVHGEGPAMQAATFLPEQHWPSRRQPNCQRRPQQEPRQRHDRARERVAARRDARAGRPEGRPDGDDRSGRHRAGRRPCLSGAHRAHRGAPGARGVEGAGAALAAGGAGGDQAVRAGDHPGRRRPTPARGVAGAARGHRPGALPLGRRRRTPGDGATGASARTRIGGPARRPRGRARADRGGCRPGPRHGGGQPGAPDPADRDGGSRGPRDVAVALGRPGVGPVTRDEGWEHFDVEADVGVRAWGPTRASAFAQATLGMFALALSPDDVVAAETREVRAQGDSPETLLVNWLNECLYVHEIEGFAVGGAEVTALGDTTVHGLLRGEEIDRARHRVGTVVRAVPLRQARVTEPGNRCEVSVVVDL